MPLSAAIQSNLSAAGVNSTMPGYRIIENARLLPPLPGSTALFGDTVQQAMRKLMKAYFDYGRQHWTWAQSAGGAAANGGLVRGMINAVACGSFNQNFKWLAEKGLGITGISNGQETGQFLTMPNSTCIDSKWVGNVRTATQGFDQFKCFKFAGHYWVVHNGVNYDVCYNDTFATPSEIIWTKLLPADPSVFSKSGLASNQVYKLDKPIPAGDHLVMLQQNGPNGWPSWQIVTKEQLKSLK